MDIEALFKKLVAEKTLAHGYLFFGPAKQHIYREVIRKMIGMLERGAWEESTQPWIDSMSIAPDEKGVISIDVMREASALLWQKPFRSPRKTLIIEDGSALTLPAQNAILKITEEPPSSALIIIMVNDCGLLIAPLVSRFQKIYCGNNTKVKFNEAIPEAKKFLKAPAIKRSAIIKEMIEDDQQMYHFVRSLMIELDRDPVANYHLLVELNHRWNNISRSNVNKRLQLEAFSQMLL